MIANKNFFYEKSISVIIPVFGWDPNLPQAISSIINQTYPPFEIIIICDEPTNEIKTFLSNINLGKINIIPVYNSERKGIAQSLNIGINLSKGKYIARMDSDDISKPKRFEKQVRFLEKNGDIGMCGSSIVTIGKRPGLKYRFPLINEEIKVTLLFRCPIAHPTVMFRSSDIKKIKYWYNSEYDHCEDYEFWSRLKLKIKFGNLHEILLYYRTHEKNTVEIFNTKHIQLSEKIRQNLIKELGIMPSLRELELHQFLCNHDKIQLSDLSELSEWLYKLICSNNESKIYNEHVFLEIIREYWYKMCSIQTTCGINTLKIYNNAKFVQKNFFQLEKILKIFFQLFFYEVLNAFFIKGGEMCP